MMITVLLDFSVAATGAGASGFWVVGSTAAGAAGTSDTTPKVLSAGATGVTGSPKEGTGSTVGSSGLCTGATGVVYACGDVSYGGSACGCVGVGTGVTGWFGS